MISCGRKTSFLIHKTYILFFLLLCILYFRQFLMKNDNKNKINFDSNEKINFDEFEVYKYNEIKEKLLNSNCSQMWANQREFLNGVIRKFKPKKVVEIGVEHGGSSIIF